MKNNTNKFGVPYHSYTLTLANGDIVNFDMAWEDSWGNVNNWNTMYDDGKDREYIGYGNEVDGYVEITNVKDDETGLDIDPFDFMKECDKYVDYYSC